MLSSSNKCVCVCVCVCVFVLIDSAFCLYYILHTLKYITFHV